METVSISEARQQLASDMKELKRGDYDGQGYYWMVYDTEILEEDFLVENVINFLYESYINSRKFAIYASYEKNDKLRKMY